MIVFPDKLPQFSLKQRFFAIIYIDIFYYIFPSSSWSLSPLLTIYFHHHDLLIYIRITSFGGACIPLQPIFLDLLKHSFFPLPSHLLILPRTFIKTLISLHLFYFLVRLSDLYATAGLHYYYYLLFLRPFYFPLYLSYCCTYLLKQSVNISSQHVF